MSVSIKVSATLFTCFLATFCSISQLIEAEVENINAERSLNPLVGFSDIFGRLSSGQNFKRVYDQINEHLNKNLPSNDIEENLKESIKWLQSGPQSEFSPKAQALAQLTALTKLKDDDLCNSESYKVLLDNDKATNGGAHRRIKSVFDRQRRIDNIVRHYFKQHSLACKGVYSIRLENELKGMDKEVLASVENIATGFMNGNLAVLASKSSGRDEEVIWRQIDSDSLRMLLKQALEEDVNSFDFATRGHLFEFQIGPLRLLEHLTTLGQGNQDRKYLIEVTDDATGKMVIKKDKIKNLMEKHIIEPCEHYVEELADLYSMSLFDEEMLDLQSEKKSDIINRLEFYVGRASYQFCSILIDQKIQKQMLDKIVESISYGFSSQTIPESSNVELLVK